MYFYTVDLYSKRTGKLVESKSFTNKDRISWYIDARKSEGLWVIYTR